MTTWQSGDHRLLLQAHDDDAISLDLRRANERNIHLLTFEALGDFVTQSLLQHQRYQWKCLTEGANGIGNERIERQGR